MANQQQVEILKQGVEVWNQWRYENETVKIDLSEADLRGLDLSEATLSVANLSGANLSRSTLSGADLNGSNLIIANLKNANLSWSTLNGADLKKADLENADLRKADLDNANLRDANLRKADLENANLIKADLWYTNLNGANLSGANLSGTNLKEVDLNGANLSVTRIGNTIFADLDLSETYGLEEVKHLGSSIIGTGTLQLSKGKIPQAFLRGCGLPDWEIESAKLHNPDLTNEEIVKIQYRIFDLRATQAFQISPLFISYSHSDTVFVDNLEKGLNEKGIRFWRDVYDMTAGKVETQIDRAIRQNPTVLLILSKNSMNSDWVQHEVRKARELEKELGRDTLCPIALDDSWKSSRWPQRVMEQVMEYNIMDFSKWEDESMFQAKFAKLLSGLNLFYKKTEG